MRLRKPLARNSASVALALALSSLLAACSGGGKHNSGAGTTTTKPRVLAVKTAVLRIGKADVESAGPPNVQIDTATGRAVLGAAQAYIDNGLFAPLKNGRIGSRYAALFDAGVKHAATSTDERALTNVDVGKVKTFSTNASPVEISALVGTLGELVYVATDFDLAEHATTGSGRLVLSHHVELTFARTGKSWLVTAYRVRTVRKSSSGTTTTTAAGGRKP